MGQGRVLLHRRVRRPAGASREPLRGGELDPPEEPAHRRPPAPSRRSRPPRPRVGRGALRRGVPRRRLRRDASSSSASTGIAPLFPNSPAFDESERLLVPVEVEQKPKRRVTMTPAAIALARTTILYAQGRDKAAAVEGACSGRSIRARARRNSLRDRRLADRARRGASHELLNRRPTRGSGRPSPRRAYPRAALVRRMALAARSREAGSEIPLRVRSTPSARRCPMPRRPHAAPTMRRPVAANRGRRLAPQRSLVDPRTGPPADRRVGPSVRFEAGRASGRPPFWAGAPALMLT